MNRCDECKHRESCVCVPYGCESFEIDLTEHDKQIRVRAVKEYKEDNEDWGEEYCKLVDSYSAKCKEVRELKDKNEQIRAEVIEEVFNLRHYAFKEDDDNMYIRVRDLEQLKENKWQEKD